jgi:Rhodanese-related sulfurtransferase
MVSALEMPALQRKGKSLLLDVNKAEDFARGHIPEALNMPLESLNTGDIALSKHKENPVIVICQSGSRSAKAAKSLIKAGFSNVNILRGGLMSWTKENLPITSNQKD